MSPRSTGLTQWVSTELASSLNNDMDMGAMEKAELVVRGWERRRVWRSGAPGLTFE